jgi:hypothetical protein
MVNELEEGQEKKPDPKLPDEFKLNSKWLVWEEAIMNYFNQVTGGLGAPLSYVLCRDAIPAAGVAYATEMEEHIARRPLTGDQYNCHQAAYPRRTSLFVYHPAD